MWPWTSHVTFLVFGCLPCNTRHLQRMVRYNLLLTISYSSDSRGLITTTLRGCHEPGSLLHILAAWPHLTLTRIPWGGAGYPHLSERKLRLRWLGCVRGANGRSGVRTEVCGTPRPGSQTLQERQSQTTGEGPRFLETRWAWRTRPRSSQEPSLLCFLIPLHDEAVASSGMEGLKATGRKQARQAGQPAGSCKLKSSQWVSLFCPKLIEISPKWDTFSFQSN